MPTEILFYHLTKKPVEQVLPGLLETCVSRGWKVVVQAGSAERVEALDALLWTYRDDSFLPHGSAKGGNGALQPVYLTDAEDTPNEATVRFFVDGAIIQAESIAALDRAILVFDGQDDTALDAARQQWTQLKTAGLAPTYWKQSDQGKWEKQAG